MPFPAPQPLFGPGTSVILIDDPKGPVRTVLQSRVAGPAIIYKVAWRDAAEMRREAEFPETELAQLNV
ncbi:MAG TPA: hypothetical protein VD994_18185 [Prosthecobacter sp.]|nr:hypothetical protein [Prosthecobacter sp.]